MGRKDWSNTRTTNAVGYSQKLGMHLIMRKNKSCQEHVKFSVSENVKFSVCMLPHQESQLLEKLHFS